MRKYKCCICDDEYNEESVVLIKGKKAICYHDLYLINKLSNAIDTRIREPKKKEFPPLKLQYPKEIVKQLDEYIVGQDKAKKILAVAAYNHYKRIILEDEDIQKSNVMLIGPTGCGKTQLVRTLAKILDVPVAITPATRLTEAGYVGDDVDSIIQYLYVTSGKNIEKTEHGIIFIDEIDKLTGNSMETLKSVGGKGVQQALLPILEGTKVQILDKPNEKKIFDSTQSIEIDTRNILFICGGAFPDAEKIIEKRLSHNKTIGFQVSKDKNQIESENLLSYITTEDLKIFGIIPELLGRVPIIATLESLSVETLKKILIEPKDSIVKQYQKLFGFDEIKLSFEDEALTLIAQEAIKKGTGARSLRSILEDILLEMMYQLPGDLSSKEVIVTKDGIKLFPKINYNILN